MDAELSALTGNATRKVDPAGHWSGEGTGPGGGESDRKSRVTTHIVLASGAWSS